MEIELFGFLLFAVSQVATPGPANLALLAVGAKYGLRHSIPFVSGVALGKQVIIWPVGFGIMALAEHTPSTFLMLKWLSIIYIFWLAYKIVNIKLSDNKDNTKSGSFILGFILHPLNPKAWGMVITSFSTFVPSNSQPVLSTTVIAIGFLVCQIIMHPLWCLGGEKIAKTVFGKTHEKFLMWFLASLAVLSVFFITFK